MKFCKQLLLYYVVFFQASAKLQAPLLSTSTQSVENAPSVSSSVLNAPHIFNTIYGAMRQWENSLKHNGMSIYPVTVEANTLLYHGGLSDKPINNVEWLAFETEHAEIFTHIVTYNPFHYTFVNIGDIDGQNYTGYLSTYRTTRPLRNVIYLDGMSAAKTSFGTIDTQDKVLLQDNNFHRRQGFRDLYRVQEICKLLPHLDGIIRMELGFELIMCDASKNLELLSITNPYFYPLNLTNPNPTKAAIPGINSYEKEKIKRMRDDIVTLFEKPSKPQQSIEWQNIVDEIVSRYSDRLAYMESNKSNKFEMIQETKFILERFINHAVPNMTASKEQCSSLYLLKAIKASTMTSSDKFIYEAVLKVSREICSLLFEVREVLLSRQDSWVVEEAKSMVRNLMNWLDWSRWKECGKCDWDEFCFVPIWPWGTQRDHDHPSCKKINQRESFLDYWDWSQ
ncbi:Uncharacterized protein OnM2_055070 [Erysiphe neolycopersici]|uniref:Uncharacterized protein n=1 Tax=Erysiphe neolycopersici TaxID=212602 RepID=A0A420HRF5_9PEZI|nr:Uncharacterized protein OnM2_055070 [Erysiphe neolycopersici]